MRSARGQSLRILCYRINDTNNDNNNLFENTNTRTQHTTDANEFNGKQFSMDFLFAESFSAYIRARIALHQALRPTFPLRAKMKCKKKKSTI